MDTSGGGPPHRGPGRDGAGAPADPGRRAPVERTDQVVSRHPGQRAPDKTDRISIGLCATGRHQERREQDTRARERLDDRFGRLTARSLPLVTADPSGKGIPAWRVYRCSYSPVLSVEERSTQVSRAIERRTVTLMSDAMSGSNRE